MKIKLYRNIGKRIFDLLLAVPALIFLTPFLLCIAVLVWVNLGRPILFRQVRPGLHGKPFTIVKFRTMIDSRGKNGKILKDSERLSGLGRFLRATSLDELPELLNVIKGDMSLVGPRPLLMQYLDRYTPEQMRRHDIRPGITGWAQVNGRNLIYFSKRLKLDIWYIDNLTFILDFKILIFTVIDVFRSKGVVVDQDVHEIDDIGLYGKNNIIENQLRNEKND